MEEIAQVVPDKKPITKPKVIKEPSKDIVKEPRKRVIKSNGIQDVINKYQECGFVANQKGTSNEIIAIKGVKTQQKLHFIRVFPSHDGTGILSSSDKSVEENNTFIQNAFSNSAVPVYAYVSYTDNVLNRILLEDINLKQAIRLVKKT